LAGNVLKKLQRIAHLPNYCSYYTLEYKILKSPLLHHSVRTKGCTTVRIVNNRKIIVSNSSIVTLESVALLSMFAVGLDACERLAVRVDFAHIAKCINILDSPCTVAMSTVTTAIS